MGKALEGVRILDMTHVQSGPSCTQMLGFLGADVIKLEPPGRGDITRGQLRDIPNVDSLYFTMLNCNKRSITLNMKSTHGKEIFTELLKTSDVLVENFGPGVLDRLGFPWETIQQINPRVIYASIKGFGTYGPNSDLKAYESIAQAMGGSMSTTGSGRRSSPVYGLADRRYRIWYPYGGGHSGSALSAHPDWARAARGSGDAGQRAQSGTCQDA